MRWIQKEGGWIDGENSSTRVERVEEISGGGDHCFDQMKILKVTSILRE